MPGAPVMVRWVLSDQNGRLLPDAESTVAKSATLCCFYGYAPQFPVEYTGEKPDDGPKYN